MGGIRIIRKHKTITQPMISNNVIAVKTTKNSGFPVKSSIKLMRNKLMRASVGPTFWMENSKILYTILTSFFNMRRAKKYDKFWGELKEKQKDPKFMKAIAKFIKLTTS